MKTEKAELSSHLYHLQTTNLKNLPPQKKRLKNEAKLLPSENSKTQRGKFNYVRYVLQSRE